MRKKLLVGVVALTCLVLLVSASPANAQRGRRGPAIHPVRPHVSIGAYFGPYYGPYFYSPWFYSNFWFYSPYQYGYPYYYGGRAVASVRVQVQPKEAQVYVDGSFAGIVDQYDGFFQSLPVEPGGHDITIYLEGFRSIVQHMYLSPGSSYKIKGAMERLAAGEPNEPRPQPMRDEPGAEPQLRQGEPREVPPSASWPRGRAPREAYPPVERQAPVPVEREEPPVAPDARFGQVAIRVQPADAQVTIDGEVWRAPEGADRLVVHLPAGTHRVEIRKDGFDPFVTSVEVKRGEVATLNVSLARL
jgi:hypothetical protein